MEIKRTDSEINILVNWATDIVQEGGSYHFDKSYEEGVLETINYLKGDKNNPMNSPAN